MLISVNPKLPMRNKKLTKTYYIDRLGFKEFGNTSYDDYLMIEKDNVQLHFFKFQELNPLENYGQVYIRTDKIKELFQFCLENRIPIHPNGKLETKPWGQMEFALLDPDSNLLTFGQAL